MGSFKQVLDSASKIQVDYICQQYPGFLRFATCIEAHAEIEAVACPGAEKVSQKDVTHRSYYEC